MGKIAFLFAGQGAQYPGMGQSLCQGSAAARSVFEAAETIRPGTQAQCFSGTAEELTVTANTQPCVFAVDLAAARALEEAGIHADGAAGFSLGEVAALTFAGSFADDAAGFSLVVARGRFMQAANEAHPGAMMAVLKMENKQVEEICEKFDHVWPVNYNCPGQLVVAGESAEIEPFGAAITAAGGRAKRLAVGGGFHSPLMHEASLAFEELLEKSDMKAPGISVYANYTAAPYAEPLRATLARQIENPVRWQQTIENLIAAGAESFLELGPGATLAGLGKRIAPDHAFLNAEDMAGIQAAVQALL